MRAARDGGRQDELRLYDVRLPDLALAIACRAKRGLDWPTMPSSTVENYVKRLYMEQQRSPERLVPMGRLAAVMGVVPGTVTTMVKALDEERLVHYEPRSGVRLTRSGEKLALHVLRRHRLVELFLVKALGLDWSEVHEEAEVLEHAVSEKVLQRIDDLLGHPTADPHGDPIPDATGTVVHRHVQTLSLIHI